MARVPPEKNERIVEFARKNEDMPMAAIATQFQVSAVHVKRLLEKAGIDVKTRTKAIRGVDARNVLKGKNGTKWNGPFTPKGRGGKKPPVIPE